jgi:hypothetical protein
MKGKISLTQYLVEKQQVSYDCYSKWWRALANVLATRLAKGT